MKNKSNFFTIKNSVNSVSQKDSEQTADYIAPIKAMARLNNMSLYVIDYHNQGFEYVSNNPLFLCGYSSEEVKEMGYEFYFKCVPEEDLNLLLKINQIGFDRYETYPIEERLNYSISYDFKIKNKENQTLLINHKLTPLFLTESGKVWRALCLVTLSSSDKSGNICVFDKKGTKILTYNLMEDCWIKTTSVSLSSREKQILRLSIRGYNIDKIAKELCISSNTVKFHRKQLFEKIEVSTINDAIFYATRNYLI